jgi:hypothetical protein
MIHFRLRPEGTPEWDTAAFSGENEELLAHQFAAFLAAAGWEFLAAHDGEPFEENLDLWEPDDAA